MYNPVKVVHNNLGGVNVNKQDELREYMNSLPQHVKEAVMQSSLEIKSVEEAKQLVENLNKK